MTYGTSPLRKPGLGATIPSRRGRAETEYAPVRNRHAAGAGFKAGETRDSTNGRLRPKIAFRQHGGEGPIATTAPIQEGPLVVLPVVGLLTCRLVRSKPSHPRSRAMALRIKKERTSATLADRKRMTAAGPSRNRTGVPCSMTLRQGPSTTSTGKLLCLDRTVKRPATEFVSGFFDSRRPGRRAASSAKAIMIESESPGCDPPQIRIFWHAET